MCGTYPIRQDRTATSGPPSSWVVLACHVSPPLSLQTLRWLSVGLGSVPKEGGGVSISSFPYHLPLAHRGKL